MTSGIGRWLAPQPARRFINVTRHFIDHGAEVGVRSEADYLLRARRFVESVFVIPEIEYFCHVDGRVYLYHNATQELAVISRQGDIITYFVPPRKHKRKHGYWEHLQKNYGRQGLITDSGHGGP